MKKILLIYLALLVTGWTCAQDYKIFNDFMKKYMNLKTSYTIPDSMSIDGFREVEQVGKPMPDYYFNKKLNSETLKGKYVILDFWATWCGGCRVLSHYMDSLMIKSTNLYTKNGIQLIGVNYKENMVNKGYKAQTYWKEKGYGFPNVDGKGAEACGDAVHAGFPTALIVDDKGIIRYRIDGAGPSTANELMFALWALKFFPESGLPLNLETVKKFLAEDKELEALYILYNLPENEKIDELRFRYTIRQDKWVGTELYQKILNRYKNTEHYQTMVRRLVEIILEEKASNLYYDAWQTLKSFFDHGLWKNESPNEILLLTGLLQYRYACSLQQRAFNMLKASNDNLLNNEFQKEIETIRTSTSNVSSIQN